MNFRAAVEDRQKLGSLVGHSSAGWSLMIPMISNWTVAVYSEGEALRHSGEPHDCFLNLPSSPLSTVSKKQDHFSRPWALPVTTNKREDRPSSPNWSFDIYDGPGGVTLWSVGSLDFPLSNIAKMRSWRKLVQKNIVWQRSFKYRWQCSEDLLAVCCVRVSIQCGSSKYLW